MTDDSMTDYFKTFWQKITIEDDRYFIHTLTSIIVNDTYDRYFIHTPVSIMTDDNLTEYFKSFWQNIKMTDGS